MTATGALVNTAFELFVFVVTLASLLEATDRLDAGAPHLFTSLFIVHRLFSPVRWLEVAVMSHGPAG
jgi:hypothetical protein